MSKDNKITVVPEVPAVEEKNTIIWNRQDTINIPASAQERRIAVRYLDWERCKKRIAKIKQDVPRFHLAFSFLFGISATSAFALISSYANPISSLPSWYYPFYISVFAFSLANAFILVLIDRMMRLSQKNEVNDVLEDMDNIEKTFPSTG